MAAQWLWRQFPRQMGSDLSQYHHRRIADWHTGEMCSYDLLMLLEFLPPQSAMSRALRMGEYSEDQLDLRHLVNEVARLRATMHAVHGGQEYEVPYLLSKAQQRYEHEAAAATEERREDVYMMADRTAKYAAMALPAPAEDNELFDDAEGRELVDA